MDKFKFRIVTMGKNKRPSMKWGTIGKRDEQLIQNLEGEKEIQSYAYVPNKGYIVVDADDQESVKKVEKLLSKLGLEAFSYKTTRGAHFLFKLPEEEFFSKLGNTINASVFIEPGGKTKIDLKGNDRGYLVSKQNWEYRARPEDIIEGFKKAPELPVMLALNTKLKININHFKAGQHDDTLFKWLPKLRAAGITKKKWIKFVLEVCFYTDYKGKHSETHEDIMNWAVVKWDSSIQMGTPKDYTKNIINKNDFKHWLFGFVGKEFGADTDTPYYQKIDVSDYTLVADHLIKEMQIVISREDNQIWGMENGIFKHLSNFQESISRVLAKEVGNIRPSLFSSITSYTKARAPLREFSKNKFLISFKNKTIDILKNEEATLALGVMNQNVIPHNLILSLDGYEEESKFVDKVMQGWTKKDKDIEKELYELIGICMTKYTGLEKAYFLLGTGSNGKSWFLKMLMTLLGHENIAHEDLKELSINKFSTSELYGKLANVNTDISSNVITDTSKFKKIVSGERIAGENKGLKKFRFAPYSTFVFGTNSVPYTNEVGDSDGSNRRIKIIPFNNQFKTGKKILSYIDKEEKLLSERVIQVIIFKALKRFTKALEEGFTESEVSKKAIQSHMVEMNHIYTFIRETKIRDDVSIVELYERYMEWAKGYHYTVFSYNHFIKKYENASRALNINVEKISHDSYDKDRHRFIKIEGGPDE